MLLRGSVSTTSLLSALHLRVYPDAQRATMSSETNVPTRQRRVSSNFITEIIDEDQRQRRYAKIVTRFPPEPTGPPHPRDRVHGIRGRRQARRAVAGRSVGEGAVCLGLL